MIDKYTGKKIVSPLDFKDNPLTTANKILADTQNLEPVITDTGKVVLSQIEIDSRCSDISALISSVERG